MFSAIYRTLWRSIGRYDSNYEFDLQVAEMRKQRAYVPADKPPPTIFAIRCHPKADQVCAELDEYFFKNWPWKDKATAQQFLRSETNRWACLALPNARDDRILDSVRVNTLLFLLDGTSSPFLLVLSFHPERAPWTCENLALPTRPLLQSPFLVALICYPLETNARI